MASTAANTEKVAADKGVPPPETIAPAEKGNFAVADVVLRFLLLASAVVAVVVIVTSKETEIVGLIPPRTPVYRTAKFNHSPAFVFFVAALSVTAFYGLVTAIISFFALLKPGSYTKFIFHFIIFDVLLLGIVAAATGAAGGVAYIGLKGNKNVQWNKICHVYKDFCKHVGASLGVSLVGSVVLVLLILLSVYSLSKKIPKHNHSH